jgi:hypothetical protein
MVDVLNRDVHIHDVALLVCFLNLQQPSVTRFEDVEETSVVDVENCGAHG